jgi:hypothetical protein
MAEVDLQKISEIELNDRGYPPKVVIGTELTHAQANDILIQTGYDRAIRNFTTDFSRFRTDQDVTAWRRQVLAHYVLSGAKYKDLQGLIWFSPQPMPDREYSINFNPEDYGINFSIRLYSQMRGRRFATRFMREVFPHFQASQSYQQSEHQGIWLQVKPDNVRAIQAFNSFGFTTIAGADEQNRQELMILPQRASRVILAAA